ncbi:hypothetical protein NHX12_026549 [Muraenolepis orangiensis]|uniref:Uncharacterized protein n=1 Tax=Muraenolepis orangiensis TaxID=630683 RepID=A0A9Q0EHP5_9TELE|nr:hypothetical protein NHX12_026549 [Muraenolepis orangiensis]
MENQRDNAVGPFTSRRTSLPVKTSAEIVHEARQSLRTLSARRPDTPRDGARQLFGGNSVRLTNRECRPPSSFSIHAQNFDAPDSRPNSGTRLSPIDHKPKLRVLELSDELAVARDPRPPTEPPVSRRGLRAQRTERAAGKDVRHRRKRRRTTTTTGDLLGPRPGTLPSSHKSRDPRPTKEPGNTKEEGESGRDQDAEAWVWDQEILPLLEQLGSAAPVDLLCDLCEGLHAALAQRDLLGRCCRRRAQILRTLFRLVDLDSPRLDLHIATLCLALCVSGNNLLNICKLIFKISRSEVNDDLFQSGSVIDALLGVLSGEDVAASGEALLYCVGALKFLSGSHTLLGLLSAGGCVGSARQLLRKLRPLSEPGHALFATAGHILVQLTAILRSLGDLPESRLHFLSHGVLPELCGALGHHQDDLDVCTNIARIYR